MFFVAFAAKSCIFSRYPRAPASSLKKGDPGACVNFYLLLILLWVLVAFQLLHAVFACSLPAGEQHEDEEHDALSRNNKVTWRKTDFLHQKVALVVSHVRDL